ncbi:double-stranded RNA-binding protein 4-like [Andrographis paniculata]|uniref:double-stranded RNA-binding protein 4-like n=1 Tax=Andrographis paniculata TaxID=175694 RepID=UPI0021E755E1|nr:double-stranded RNA-binding protein 4-like [Andrographis paniculata]
MDNLLQGSMAAPQPPPTDTSYKNQLQRYTLRASLGFPQYKTVGEGTPHAPQFRSMVYVDGTCYTSQQTFSTRKAAEQEAARLALIGIPEKVKNEASSCLLASTVFCKSIIVEYAVKMNLGLPEYTTKQSKPNVPIFVSTVCLNGVSYIGQAGNTKKEAEQHAARTAVLSILDSESNTTMSEIVRSKFKFYNELNNAKDLINTNCGTMPDGVNVLEDGGASCSLSNKRKEVHISEGSATADLAPNSKSISSEPNSESSLLGPNPDVQPIHEFKRKKTETPLSPPAAADLPIQFVAPASPTCSAAARKRKRKKERKRAQLQSSLPVAGILQNPEPEPSTAQ